MAGSFSVCSPDGDAGVSPLAEATVNTVATSVSRVGELPDGGHGGFVFAGFDLLSFDDGQVDGLGERGGRSGPGPNAACGPPHR